MVKTNRTYRWLLVLSVLLSQVLVAQRDYVSLFDELTDYETSDERKSALSDILTTHLFDDLNEDLNTCDTLGIRQLKIAASPDSTMKIFTWYYALNDATAQYGGLLVNGTNVIRLRYANLPIVEDEKYTEDEWCGGVYYDIIPVRKKGQVYYTLLSWDGNNGVSYRKIADALWFDKKGTAVFGSPIFENERNLTNRVIIEYSAKTSLLFEYDEAHNGIVANALMQNYDDFEGVSASYGASDVFNIYRFESEKWVLYPDVDLSFDAVDSKLLRSQKQAPEKGL